MMGGDEEALSNQKTKKLCQQSSNSFLSPQRAQN